MKQISLILKFSDISYSSARRPLTLSDCIVKYNKAKTTQNLLKCYDRIREAEKKYYWPGH